jgi:poly(3-hydroxybutyrate) depolymerase
MLTQAYSLNYIGSLRVTTSQIDSPNSIARNVPPNWGRTGSSMYAPLNGPAAKRRELTNVSAMAFIVWSRAGHGLRRSFSLYDNTSIDNGRTSWANRMEVLAYGARLGMKRRYASLASELSPEPPVSKLRLYAGADQPARLSLEISSIRGQERLVPVVSQDVLQMPFCALTRFAPLDGMHLPKVLVVAPLSGHFSILLRDLVIGLLPTFQVFITEWVNARHIALEQGPFDLERNTSYVIEMMERLGKGLNVMALCQGALPALLATAYLAEKCQESAPRTLVLVAAPVDPAENPTRIARLIKARSLSWYERNVIARVPAPCRGSGRLIYPGSVQLLGLQGYLARHLCQGGELFRKTLQDDGDDPLRFPFLDLYSTLMDLPAEVFLDILRHVYQERSVWKGVLLARGQQLDFSAVRSTALMTVEGEDDDIAPLGQTRRAHDLCPLVPADARRQLVVPACGHFSLFHGSLWRTQVLPEVRAFMDRFDRTGSSTTRSAISCAV